MSDKTADIEVEEMDGKSKDVWEEKQGILEDVLPGVLSEGDVDVEKLKKLIGEDNIARGERYNFTWAGKSDAIQEIKKRTTATLKPNKDESVNFEDTENLFIEGENLEVLRALQKAYYGKVKMIYIDPPYNTGNDFVYNDNFSESVEDYNGKTGDMDENGKMIRALQKNTKEKGHYHSNWLSMMYPRLFHAKNLLKENGVIFVSIDDNEVHNLKLVMNEIFGEENFVTQFVWNTEGHTDNQFDVKVNHEYILLYAKNWDETSLGYVIDPNTPEDSNVRKGFAENSITKNGSGNPPSTVELPPGFPCVEDSMELEKSEVDKEFFTEVEKQGYITRKMTKKYEVDYPIRKTKMVVRDGKLAEPCKVYSGWANVDKLKQFIKNDCNPLEEDNGNILKFYLSENGVIYYKRERENVRHILSVLRNMGTTEKMSRELEEMGIEFQYPKPKKLLKYLVKMGSSSDDIIMDFFAGSCTTAQAVIEANSEENIDSSRKFIMIQLPEKTDEDSEARKVGYETVSEIGKERIRKASDEIKGEVPKLIDEKIDCGFKVVQLSDSNFRNWVKQEIEDEDKLQQKLEEIINNVKPDVRKENMLYELMFKLGLNPNVEIEEKDGYYRLLDGEYLISLADEIDSDLAETFLDEDPRVVVCLDKAFKGDDELKTNTALQMQSEEITFKVV